MKKFIFCYYLFFCIATNAYCDDKDLDGEINIKIGIDLKKQSHGLSYLNMHMASSSNNLHVQYKVIVY
jgi:hypothetical protein